MEHTNKCGWAINVICGCTKQDSYICLRVILGYVHIHCKHFKEHYTLYINMKKKYIYIIKVPTINGIGTSYMFIC